MQEIILLKDGELALKGLNRSTFEDILNKNIRQRLRSTVGEFKITRSQSTTVIQPCDEFADLDKAVEVIRRVFGVVGISRAAQCEKDMDIIKRTAVEYLADDLNSAKTFKVEAKRSDKQFPLKSPEICNEVGGCILSKFHHLKVDVHNPDIKVTVEIRDYHAFIHGNQIRGAGGMPTGTGGNACVLISGGIDSPVAAWMMAKRGIKLTAVHFASPPYTSDRAEMKVHELLSKVAEYSGNIELYTVFFTEIQERIRDFSPEEMFTVTMRRLMMKISGEIAKRCDCRALITGESVGQVASQTIYALSCTDDASDMPVFRPLIGMDKSEIIEIARKIDTFDISIEPYEDCCTVFTPKHPKTRPTVQAARDAEAAAWDDELVK
ncbi:MAG: tRNA 4-thiouridine(8) synthase ThiI, partial [Clostridiales bacterium]|nr:tRNA 4-thiouridine(8) synthase ThiI [Clostridiales bacterium]